MRRHVSLIVLLMSFSAGWVWAKGRALTVAQRATRIAKAEEKTARELGKTVEKLRRQVQKVTYATAGATATIAGNPTGRSLGLSPGEGVVLMQAPSGRPPEIIERLEIKSPTELGRKIRFEIAGTTAKSVTKEFQAFLKKYDKRRRSGAAAPK